MHTPPAKVPSKRRASRKVPVAEKEEEGTKTKEVPLSVVTTGTNVFSTLTATPDSSQQPMTKISNPVAVEERSMDSWEDVSPSKTSLADNDSTMRMLSVSTSESGDTGDEEEEVEVEEEHPEDEDSNRTVSELDDNRASPTSVAVVFSKGSYSDRNHSKSALAPSRSKQRIIENSVSITSGADASAPNIPPATPRVLSTDNLVVPDCIIATTSSNSGSSTIEQLEEQLKSAHMQRQKMSANLKKKKTMLEDANAARHALEVKMTEMQSVLTKQQSESDHLRAGLQQVVTVRDDIKNKLRIKNEILRELRVEKEEVERKLRKSENQRAMEKDLLTHYRKLAQHTGYFKWGKEIRILESALEQHNLAESSGSASSGGNTSK